MSERLASFPRAGWLALAGTLFILVFVPLAPGRQAVGGLPLDTVILTVPIAVALAVPLFTRTGREGIPRIGIELPALVFLGWALLGMLFTGTQLAVMATWARYASYLLLVYAVAAVSTDEIRRRILLWVLALAGSVTVGHGFWQYVNPSQNIGMQGLDASVATRVFATFDNPNFYAEFLVLLFAVTLALVFVERGFLRYFAVALLCAQAMALLLTYTRGSWLALAVGLVVGVLMIDSRLLFPFIGAAAAMLPLVPGALARVMSIFSLEGTASFRLKLWEVAGAAMLERPVFGYGMGRFYDAFKEAVLNNTQLNVGFLFYGAHNSYFQLGAEIGIAGMLAFGWLVFEACRMGVFYNARMGEDLRPRLINAALTAGLVAFAINALTSNAFQHPRGAVFFWVLVGVQAGLGARYWRIPIIPRKRIPRPIGLWASSRVGRAFRAVTGWMGATWSASMANRLLTRDPAGDGRVLAGSILARVVFGDGPEISPAGPVRPAGGDAGS